MSDGSIGLEGALIVKTPKEDRYSDAETVRRREATIQRMLATPHRPHEKLKLGRSKRVAESIKKDSTRANKKGGRRPSKRG
jgi:hypothetical protein